MFVSRVGYDREVDFTEEELQILYILEGKSKEDAQRLAKSLSREIHNMICKDKNFWKRTRRSESTGFRIDECSNDE